MAAHIASTDNRAIDVLRVVMGHIARTTTTVGDLGCRHVEKTASSDSAFLEIGVGLFECLEQ